MYTIKAEQFNLTLVEFHFIAKQKKWDIYTSYIEDQGSRFESYIVVFEKFDHLMEFIIYVKNSIPQSRYKN